MVSSPRPRRFQLNALNLVSKAQALADVPYMGPVFGVSKTSISGFVAVGPHCIYIYIYEIIQLEPLENIQLEPFWNKIMGGSNCGRVLTVQLLVKQGKLRGSKCVARILEKKVLSDCPSL